MTSTVDNLSQRLNEVITLLREHNEAHWADWLEQTNGLIAIGDVDGVNKLQAAFAGMGSFNDLVVRRQQVQREYPAEIFWSQDDITANERLDLLRACIYQLLMQVKHGPKVD